MGPVFTAVTAVAGLAMQARAVRAQDRASRVQTEIAREQQRQQEVQAMASRRRSIRASQVARARTLASGQAMGATGGSAVAGGLTSLSSQLGGSLGYQTQMTGISRNISGLSQQAGTLIAQANRAEGTANLFGSASRFGSQFGSFEDFTGMFG